MLIKLFKFLLRKKLIVGIGLALIAGGVYFGYKELTKDSGTVSYVTAAVAKGALIISVSGSGQVSASDQIDIKPEVSGEVVYVGVNNGQKVEADTLLVQIDSHEAQKAVKDAKTSLETAKLELEDLLNPPDELSILQAENAVTVAKNDLEELVNPSQSTLTQAENSLIAAQDSLTKLKFSQETGYQDALNAQALAKDNLEEAYENAFSAISSAFLELPTLITGLRDVLYSYGIADSQSGFSRAWNISALKNSIDYEGQINLQKFINSAEADYQTARIKYDVNFDNYKNTSRYSARSVIEILLEETLETVRAMADSVKSETNLLDNWVDYRSEYDLPIFTKVAAYQSDVKSYTSQINSYLSSLLSAQRSIEDYKEDISDAARNLAETRQNQPLDLAAAERSVQEKEEALDKLKNPEPDEVEAAQIAVKEKELALKELKAGADELDIRAKRIALQQKEETWLSAQQDLADYYIRAPFAGIIADLAVKKGELVSSNAVATLITDQKIAEITLNEIDIAKVKVGQKASLNFDAVEDLSITGEVVEIDTLGTVSQGVVSYNVKIAFDVQDERIKPGMSVSVNIITESKPSVLLAPINAVKTMGTGSYVEILVDGQPQRKTVTAGLSSDTMIEIVEGLEEGEKIITQTTSSNSGGSSSPSQNSQNGSSGFGGEFRMLR